MEQPHKFIPEKSKEKSSKTISKKDKKEINQPSPKQASKKDKEKTMTPCKDLLGGAEEKDINKWRQNTVPGCGVEGLWIRYCKKEFIPGENQSFTTYPAYTNDRTQVCK